MKRDQVMNPGVLEDENIMPSEAAVQGDWVEIDDVILQPGERAKNIPNDTQKVPLTMRLRGFLLNSQANIGESVRIQTRIGRIVEGRLAVRFPKYNHTFGEPQKELLAIGQELRSFLIKGGINDGR